MAASTVENIGNLKWWAGGSEASGEVVSAGEEAVASAGMARGEDESLLCHQCNGCYQEGSC